MKKVRITKHTHEEFDEIFQTLKDTCYSSMDYKEVNDYIHKSLGGLSYQIHRQEKGRPLKMYRLTTPSLIPNFKENDVGMYGPPPKEVAPINRLNIEKHPLLYTSFDYKTVLLESKKNLKESDMYYLSVWKTNPNIEHYVHNLIINSTTLSDNQSPLYTHAHSLKNGAEDIYKRLNELEELDFDVTYPAMKMGDLLVSKDKDYIFSSKYGHYLMYDFGGAHKPKMCQYPSVEDELESMNLVIHPDCLNDYSVYLDSIICLKIDRLDGNDIDLKIIKKGSVNSYTSEITWKSIFVSELELDFKNVICILENGQEIQGERVMDLWISENNMTLRQTINKIFDTSKRKELVNDMQSIVLENLIKGYKMGNYKIDANVHWELENNNEKMIVKRVIIPYFFEIDFK